MHDSTLPSLRVAMISEHASPLAAAGGVDAGGQNIYVEQVSRRLAAAGHEVDVLTRRDDPALPPRVDLCPGVRVLHLDAGPPRFVAKEALLQHMPAFAQAASRLLRSGRGYDVVHANFFMSGWVGLALQRRFSLPLVVTFHALGLVRREHQRDADGFPAERIEIERALVRQADALIAECPQDDIDLVRLYGADPTRIVQIPCGVDARDFAPGDKAAARQRLGLPQHEFIVLQLGRMVPRKGIDNVVQAMALLPQGGGVRASRLVVVGGATREPDAAATPEIGRLATLAGELGIGHAVQFAGRRDRQELRDWYVAADVFVTTPWYEPFGITPLEAMACGTPVVGSAVGGIQYTVVDGVTGFLVPPHDPASLALCLNELRRNPQLAQTLGRAGARRVRSLFTWDGVAGKLQAVYEQVRAADHGPLTLAPPALHAATPRWTGGSAGRLAS